MRLGPALDHLLTRASDALGEPSTVDLGDDDGPLCELAELLTTRNGFYAFNMGVQVLRIGERGSGPELRWWNEHPWKLAYGRLAQNLFCFAQDLFGTQFGIDADRNVVAFDPEDAQRLVVSDSLDGWADWLLAEPDLRGCDAFARTWQQRYRPLDHYERLVPETMACLGGSYDLDTLRPAVGEQLLAERGALGRATHPAPGATIMTLLASATFQVLADGGMIYLDSAPVSYDVDRVSHDGQAQNAIADGYAIDPASPGLLLVCTARPLTVPVDVEIHDEPPAVDLDDYDGVVETSLDLRSGRVGSYGGYGEANPNAVVDVPAGTYRVLVCFANLLRVSDDGLEGDDRYRFLFWPTERPGDLGDRGPRVRKPLPEKWG